MHLYLVSALLLGVANAHTIGQKLSVNGVEQPAVAGVRVPRYPDPVESYELDNSALACNRYLLDPLTPEVVDVPSGARVGMWWWGYVKGRTQVELDYCISSSHHGPSSFWLAKVDDAITANATELDWFKISEDGLTAPDSWAIDRMRKVDGCWTYTQLPQCLAPGNYLLRAEILALHLAQYAGQAQFFLSCAQINVVGGGGSWTGSNHVKFPGAYTAEDPSIHINICPVGSNGLCQYDNGGKPYVVPGGPVQTCPSGGTSITSTISSASTTGAASSTLASSTSKLVSSTITRPVSSTTARPTSSTTTSTSRVATSSAPAGPMAQLYAQCGGKGWTGPTACASGTCKVSGEYYSQCLP